MGVLAKQEMQNGLMKGVFDHSNFGGPERGCARPRSKSWPGSSFLLLLPCIRSTLGTISFLFSRNRLVTLPKAGKFGKFCVSGFALILPRMMMECFLVGQVGEGGGKLEVVPILNTQAFLLLAHAAAAAAVVVVVLHTPVPACPRAVNPQLH